MKAIPAARRLRIRRALLRWFRRNARPMPWRRTRDPYRVWVSEVLLQQTTVAAVGRYYRRFLRRFPTVGRLAAAPRAEVLREWSGLGYYARARNLHEAAKRVVAEHGGRLPDTRERLLALPGIGEYTASALLSFVHGRPVAVVDGNVARVVSRLFLVGGDPRSGAVMRRLRELAGALVAPRRSREFNLAMMDLGSVVCRPRSPLCPECPLSPACRARARRLQDRYPGLAPRRRPVRVERLVAVLAGDERLFLVPRAEDGLLGGLWELPGCDGPPGGAAVRLSRGLSRRWGVRVRTGGEIAVADHAITYRRIRIRAFRASIPGGAVLPAGKWIRRRDLSRYPITTATRKILDRLEGVREAGGKPRRRRVAGRRRGEESRT